MQHQGTVLIVDDSEPNRNLLSRRLERAGYTVATADGGHRALEMIALQNYDLVLLDILMPDLDGIDVLERLRQSRSATDLPVIMVTAKDESEDMVRALNSGANDYVTKPLDMPVVLARVQTQLSLKRATDELHRANTELIAARERAEVANNAKSDFLAKMSHELRTPLNAILGYAQILQQDRQTTPRQLNRANIIAKSGHHLLRMIEDMLDLASIEANQTELYLEALNLHELLQSIADIMQVRAEQNGLRLVYDAPEGSSRVRADPKRLRQVLLNLLGNAIRFTDQGEVTLRVSTRPFGNAAVAAKFVVEDTGIGIAPEDLAKLFSPFQQFGDVAHRRGGTGLGLAISRQLVRLMGADMQVSSELGRGSRFGFEVVFETAAPEAHDPAVASFIVGYEGPRKSVLIVDDIAENRSLLVDLLAPLGFMLHEAVNGEECIERARALRPDAILMDSVMPGIDGLEATRRLRDAGFQDATIIAISASASRADEERSRAAGTTAFLAKPVQLDALLALLEQHLNIRFTHDVRPR